VVLDASVTHLPATQYVLSELHQGLTEKFSPSGSFVTLNVQNIFTQAGNKGNVQLI